MGLLHAFQIGTLPDLIQIVEGRGHTLKNTTVLFTEAEAYQMLLRGHAPQSEPFRKWVTEEVLPELRKNGLYSPARSLLPSQDPETVHQINQIQEELQALKMQVQMLLKRVEGPKPLSLPPPKRGPIRALLSLFSRK